MALLEVKGITKYFGGLAAVRDVTFAVNGGEVVGLIGPNGAGKTTLFNVISGVYRPTAGKILYQGHDIIGMPFHKIASLGLVRTFQITNLFKDMTVFENVLVSTHRASGSAFLGSLLRTPAEKRRSKWAYERAHETVEFVGLSENKDQVASSLPYGHQRVLSVAVALAANPKLLLLDEPMAGMNPTEAMTMVNDLRRIRDTGITLIVVEHNMTALMALAERIVVLNFGQKLAEGRPEEVRQNKDVIEAYLGMETSMRAI
jgi:branched-chain amino acid transport system ATP-binding protein